MRAQLASEAKDRGSRLTLLMGGRAKTAYLRREVFTRSLSGECDSSLRKDYAEPMAPYQGKLFNKQITSKSKNEYEIIKLQNLNRP